MFTHRKKTEMPISNNAPPGRAEKCRCLNATT